MSEPYPWDLLVRYGAGHITPAEAEWLAAWSAGASERALLLRQTRRLVELSRAAEAVDDAADAWRRLERRLSDAKPDVRMLAVHPTRVPSISTSQDQRRITRRWWAGFIAVAAVAVVVLGIRLGIARSPDTQRTALREVVTRRGERLEFGLPDGSRVVLGPASRLRFVIASFALARTLVLEGEEHTVYCPVIRRTKFLACTVYDQAPRLRPRSNRSTLR